MIPGFDNAQTRSEQAILEAEKFKAQIAEPTGKQIFENFAPSITSVRQTDVVDRIPTNVINPIMGNGLSDDDFFHITCHIDEQLRQKIERGQFVDLDRLLPKERFGGSFERNTESGNPMQWIQNEYGTYLVPAKKTNKINGFKRWEQAFRVYATIYCGENPNRSREVWQYISVINTAANSYVWDNVYNYDIIFRQLMEFNPARSWAVTYTQMWNLSMKQSLSSVSNNMNGGRTSGGGMIIPSQNGRPGRKIKSDYCWSFNRGEPCKFGKNCKFKERCSYCDSPSHGIYTCFKLDKKEGNFHQGNQNYHQNGGFNNYQQHYQQHQQNTTFQHQQHHPQQNNHTNGAQGQRKVANTTHSNVNSGGNAATNTKPPIVNK